VPSQTVAFQDAAAGPPEFIAVLLQAAQEVPALFDSVAEPANVGAAGCLVIGRALRECGRNGGAKHDRQDKFTNHDQFRLSYRTHLPAKPAAGALHIKPWYRA